MRRKYFFFDIDGTLCSGLTMRMPESAVRCVQRLREKGHFVALATGRLQASAAGFAGRYGFEDFVADGGYSLTIGGRVVEMRSLPVEHCIALIDRLDAADIPWAVTVENERVCITRDKRYLPYAPRDYFTVKVDPDFDCRQLRQLYKVYIVCTPEQQKEIDCGPLPSVRYNGDVLFIEPTSKQDGIRRMLARLSAADEDVVVFGDGTNDVCMFGQGWLCIAMGNARTVLKRCADYVTTGVDEDGLWNACSHFGWI